jgi:hypothetical protein
MKLCQDVIVQQVFMPIGNIQDRDSFECTWKIFDTNAIVIPNYEHSPFHYILSSNI